MYRHILNSIADSESIYLECLSVSLQYMKAMKVTLATPQPVIPKEDFDVIFFKIPELHEFHYHFHESLKKQVCVQQVKIILIVSKFLTNPSILHIGLLFLHQEEGNKNPLTDFLDEHCIQQLHCFLAIFIFYYNGKKQDLLLQLVTADILFIKYHSSNTIYRIPLSNTLYQISFIKYYLQFFLMNQ